MCVHFLNFDHLRITLQGSDLIWGTKFRAPSLPLPQFIFSFLQALIHGFLWWWASSWLIFSLKWRLQSSFFLLHSTAIDFQEAKDSIDEEDSRPTSSTWSYIMASNLKDVKKALLGGNPVFLHFVLICVTWILCLMFLNYISELYF